MHFADYQADGAASCDGSSLSPILPAGKASNTGPEFL